MNDYLPLDNIRRLIKYETKFLPSELQVLTLAQDGKVRFKKDGNILVFNYYDVSDFYHKKENRTASCKKYRNDSEEEDPADEKFIKAWVKRNFKEEEK